MNRTSKGYAPLLEIVLGVGLLFAHVCQVHAYAVPQEYLDKLLPAYPSKKGECYVLLKPLSPYVESGRSPVCVAAVRNLNKFCSEPPQYDRRKVHADIDGLREPNWVAMDAKENFDIVKQTFLARFRAQYREGRWEANEARLAELAHRGVLQLFRADVADSNVRLRGAINGAYRLVNAGETQNPGFNQPYVRFETQPEVSHDILSSFAYQLYSDLWIFKDDLYLVTYWPQDRPMHRAFVIYELIRPQVGPDAPIGASERCTIQHINDRAGGK